MLDASLRYLSVILGLIAFILMLIVSLAVGVDPLCSMIRAVIGFGVVILLAAILSRILLRMIHSNEKDSDSVIDTEDVSSHQTKIS